ncbi:efflux RND transporter permease subunit [Lachnoclostridium pacaense]|uniref:efflux RND transporter permease subunit n=1 Tax=Enterocloster hominis (ex Hitch et al. 2024) TaxID=1917870 RepID=UPI001D0FB2FF|nr:efflux RND transporter permease subunit [Lachnoclostridium pacaense]MCC2817181.1 efflux RND transporter permease subunit [Lachnoclostridium pacaense]
MKHLTEIVLKRPITVIMCLLCLVIFGLSSVKSAKQELTPEMNMPMMMVLTTYTGAQPKDVDELVSKEIENAVGALSGIKKISSTSSENRSVVTIQYEYSKDLDEAYDDLKKKIDAIASDLPDDADTPVIMELDTGSSADMMLVVSRHGEENQYGYVNRELVPEFEKLSNVAEVSIAGGSEDYIRVELIPEQMSQYKLSLSSIANDITTADVEAPGGSIGVGRKNAAISTRLGFDTEDSLVGIPLTVTAGNIVYLSDVANIYTTQTEDGSLAHYNGAETVLLSISKQQSATADELSKDVGRVIRSLAAEDASLDIHVVNDSSEDIKASLLSIAETVLLAMIISMIVIWLFFGEIKASLIVGSSIPVSILTALILMQAMDFSLNMLTLAALSMGVGMMVDNSIVVLESCFRTTEKNQGDFVDYFRSALEGTGVVGASVLGSTLTTCVVFLPLAFLSGMAGQLFKPLGFTIVFCMSASLISAITIVPMCYMLYKPEEKQKAPLSAPIRKLQSGYRRIMRYILPKKKTVMGISVLLLVASFWMAGTLDVNLLTSDDQGQLTITVEMAPGLKTAEAEKVMSKVEAAFSDYEELESYVASYGGSGSGSMDSVSINVYLTEDREISTKKAVKIFKEKLSTLTDCNVSVEEATLAGNTATSGYELILKSTDYDELKETSDQIVSELMLRDDVTRVHSSLENSAPVVEVTVDAIKAKAAGIIPSTIGSSVYQAINGRKAASLKINGEDVDVKVEYPYGEFSTADRVRQMTLSLNDGGYVALGDVAALSFQDSPASIKREDKQYTVTVSADYTGLADKQTKPRIDAEVVESKMTATVNQGSSSLDETTMEEMTSLLSAVLLAMFLVFVVMAAQFESPRFSFMVMTTVPFSLIGAFGLMFLVGSELSMVVLLGFLMLIGTVVNAGILYVDTVNQNLETMEPVEAMIEAGATRMRPILMTTFTTLLSMVPMALALGHSGQMMQGLAIVNIGGLTASTALSLLMLPVYYSIMCKKEKKEMVKEHTDI